MNFRRGERRAATNKKVGRAIKQLTAYQRNGIAQQMLAVFYVFLMDSERRRSGLACLAEAEKCRVPAKAGPDGVASVTRGGTARQPASRASSGSDPGDRSYQLPPGRGQTPVTGRINFRGCAGPTWSARCPATTQLRSSASATPRPERRAPSGRLG